MTRSARGAVVAHLLWLQLLLVLWPGAARAQPKAERVVNDGAVSKAVAQHQLALIRAQRADGSWAYQGYPVGMTALAVLALKHSGLPGDHPAVAKGVAYIVGNTDTKVYSEALVACALELAGPERYLRRIKLAAKALAASQSAEGSWRYSVKGKASGDNSNTQFAILGLAAAERCGVAIPKRVRERALLHWEETQGEAGGPGKEGGWSYASRRQLIARPPPGRNAPRPVQRRVNATPSMTCAGIASLHLLGRSLEEPGRQCGEYEQNPVIAKGLACLSEMFRANQRLEFGGRQSYTLYSIERVGIFLGLQQIGGVDWYARGARTILGMPLPRSTPDVATNLLFLAKGNAQVAIAKWRWQGDWNNDHRDLEGWTSLVQTQDGGILDSITADLDVKNSPAAKASMIFVSGHGEFTASEQELEFLRGFLLGRGTLVAEACCGREAFAESFKEVILRELFPAVPTKWLPLDEGHPVCSSKYALAPDEVGALEFKAGCRKVNVLLLTRDISCALNEEPAPRKERRRSEKVAENILTWALRSRRPERRLKEVSGGASAALNAQLTPDQVQRKAATQGADYESAFGRLVHRGDWAADPSFFSTLGAAFAKAKELPVFDGELAVDPTSDDLSHVALLFMTGHEDPALREGELLNLRGYLQNGGFLLASACCSSQTFDRGFRGMLSVVLPNDALERIPRSDALFLTPYPCRTEQSSGTKAYRKRFGRGWGPLYGVRREGRWIVVYSPIDLCCGFEGDADEWIASYGVESAFRLLGNIANHAFQP